MGVFAPGYSRPERKGESTEFQRQCASIMLSRLETALAHQLLCLIREVEGDGSSVSRAIESTHMTMSTPYPVLLLTRIAEGMARAASGQRQDKDETDRGLS